MLDVAVFIMHRIKKLEILFVSNQVKADLARSIANFTKTQCSEKHLLVYAKSITFMLIDLMADENFQHDKLIQYASIMATGASVATPLLSGGDEQTTPLTSNVSAPLQQKLLSHQNQKANHQSSCHPFKRNLLSPMVVVVLWDTLISMLNLQSSLKSKSKLVHLFQ